SHKNRIRVSVGIKSQGDPTAPLNRYFQCNLLHRSIRNDILLRDRIRVDDCLNGHRLAVQPRSDLRREANGGRLIEPDFTATRPNRDSLLWAADRGGNELHQVTRAVADIAASVANTFAPLLINQFASRLHIHAAHADALS